MKKLGLFLIMFSMVGSQVLVADGLEDEIVSDHPLKDSDLEVTPETIKNMKLSDLHNMENHALENQKCRNIWDKCSKICFDKLNNAFDKCHEITDKDKQRAKEMKDIVNVFYRNSISIAPDKNYIDKKIKVYPFRSVINKFVWAMMHKHSGVKNFAQDFCNTLIAIKTQIEEQISAKLVYIEYENFHNFDLKDIQLFARVCEIIAANGGCSDSVKPVSLAKTFDDAKKEFKITDTCKENNCKSCKKASKRSENPITDQNIVTVEKNTDANLEAVPEEKSWLGTVGKYLAILAGLGGTAFVGKKIYDNLTETKTKVDGVADKLNNTLDSSLVKFCTHPANWVYEKGLNAWSWCTSWFSDSKVNDNKNDIELKDITGPNNNTTVPSNNTTVPSNNTTVPSNNTTVPSNNTTVPSNNTLVPSNNTLVPSNNTTVPSNNTTVPSNNTLVPSNNTTVPSNNTTVPSNNTTVPSNNTTVPSNNTTVPSNNTTVPSNNTTVPSNNTTVPSNNTTVPIPNNTPVQTDVVPNNSDNSCFSWSWNGIKNYLFPYKDKDKVYPENYDNQPTENGLLGF